MGKPKGKGSGGVYVSDSRGNLVKVGAGSGTAVGGRQNIQQSSGGPSSSVRSSKSTDAGGGGLSTLDKLNLAAAPSVAGLRGIPLESVSIGAKNLTLSLESDARMVGTSSISIGSMNLYSALNQKDSSLRNTKVSGISQVGLSQDSSGVKLLNALRQSVGLPKSLRSTPLSRSEIPSIGGMTVMDAPLWNATPQQIKALKPDTSARIGDLSFSDVQMPDLTKTGIDRILKQSKIDQALEQKQLDDQYQEIMDQIDPGFFGSLKSALGSAGSAVSNAAEGVKDWTKTALFVIGGVLLGSLLSKK